MDSPESQQALATFLRALTFATILLATAISFRILPEDLRRALQATLSQHDTNDYPARGQSTQAPSPPDPTIELPRPPPLTASDHINSGKHHLLLAATGSVATIKIPLILRALSQQRNLSIRLILTSSATQFLAGQSAEQPRLASLLDIPNVEAIYLDRDEWVRPWTRGAPILHIELRRWADLMVVAPVSANALGKLANGASDDLVSSVARAWDATGLIDGARPGVALPYGGGTRKGIVLAPAMNTAMWEHPVTREHVAKLEGEGWNVGKGGWIELLRPVEKDLACGDVGSGAMKEWKDIVRIVEERLGLGEAQTEDGYVDVEDVKKTK